MKIRKRLLFGIVILLTSVVVIIKNDVVVKAAKETENLKIGIIDGSLSSSSDKPGITKVTIKESKSETHGDTMIAFAREYAKDNMEIFYYDATDDNMNITSGKIIDALEWMVNNQVEYVNISLSTKVYSEVLAQWIEAHSPEIRVFASYNNLRNTKDYPAMYEGVIASGYNNGLKFKTQDSIYESNDIVLFPALKKYRGNDYLSMITMIDTAREEHR